MRRSAVEVKRIIHKTINLLKNYIVIDQGYLFGSYACGGQHKDSDIDLAFFSMTLNRMELDEKITIVAKLGEQLGCAVDIHLFPKDCLKKARHTNFYGHILETGKRIA